MSGGVSLTSREHEIPTGDTSRYQHLHSRRLIYHWLTRFRYGPTTRNEFYPSTAQSSPHLSSSVRRQATVSVNGYADRCLRRTGNHQFSLHLLLEQQCVRQLCSLWKRWSAGFGVVKYLSRGSRYQTRLRDMVPRSRQ